MTDLEAETAITVRSITQLCYILKLYRRATFFGSTCTSLQNVHICKARHMQYNRQLSAFIWIFAAKMGKTRLI